MADTRSGLVRRVRAGGIGLAYRTWGAAEAPPVVLHALGEQSSDWAPVAAALASSWRVYAPDLRGHGASDWPGSYTIEQLTTDLAASLIPDCELITIPAGHLVHAVRPAEFTAAVTGFLRRGRLEPEGPYSQSGEADFRP